MTPPHDASTQSTQASRKQTNRSANGNPLTAATYKAVRLRRQAVRFIDNHVSACGLRNSDERFSDLVATLVASRARQTPPRSGDISAITRPAPLFPNFNEIPRRSSARRPVRVDRMYRPRRADSQGLFRRIRVGSRLRSTPMEPRPRGSRLVEVGEGQEDRSRTTSSLARAPVFPSSPSLRDGNMKQAGQPPLRAGPRLRAQLAEHLGLRLGPQRPRDGQGSSSLVRDLHRLDSPVGMRSTLEQPIPLQEAEAARQCRLVDGESTLELFQVRLAHVHDGRENAELRHPETA